MSIKDSAIAFSLGIAFVIGLIIWTMRQERKDKRTFKKLAKNPKN